MPVETKFKISDEILKEAIASSHTACEQPEGCVHANAITMDGAEIMCKRVVEVEATTEHSGAQHLRLWYDGFHVGYRLAQLLFEKANPEKLN